MNYEDAFDPSRRSFQGELIKTAVARFVAGEKVTVGLIWCGSGKTLAAQAVTTSLMRLRPSDRKRIKYVLWYTPRVVLAQQAEVNYRHAVRDDRERAVVDPATGDPAEDGDFLMFDARCRLEYLWHRANKAPIMPDGADMTGLVSTYQSLVEDSKKSAREGGQLHLDWARKHKGEFLLVADEAQFCGAPSDDDDLGSPLAGQFIAQMSGHAAHTLLLTGTADRADSRKLVLCEDLYEADKRGRLHLRPDVEALYWQGIAQGYLREFDVAIHETRVRLESGIEYDLSMSSKQPPEERAALAEVLRDPKVWKPLCDLTIKRLRYMQQINGGSNYRALFACMQVSEAREVLSYLTAKGVKAMIAVAEDGAKAKNALRQFKHCPYDALVTVRMAFLGYDCPEITAVCVLTNYRDMGHLAQLVFRGGRVWKDGGPAKSQTLHLAVPDDQAMQRFIDYLRTEQAKGIRLREDGEGPPPPPAGNGAVLDQAWVASVRGATNDRDISPEEYAEGQAILDELGPITTPDQIRQLQMKLFSGHQWAAPESPGPEKQASMPKTDREITDTEKGKAARKIGEFLRAKDHHPGDPNYQPARGRLTRRINNAFGINSTDEITTATRATAYLEHVQAHLRQVAEESS